MKLAYKHTQQQKLSASQRHCLLPPASLLQKYDDLGTKPQVSRPFNVGGDAMIMGALLILLPLRRCRGNAVNIIQAAAQPTPARFSRARQITTWVCLWLVRNLYVGRIVQ